MSFSGLFTGFGGRIYAVGDLFEFKNAPLEGLNDGWDWRAPEEMRLWKSEMDFEVWEHGRWSRIHPAELHPRSGTVSFPRSLEGLHVRASGWCMTTTFLGESPRWRVEVERVVQNASVLGVGTVVTKTRPVGVRATVELPEGTLGRVYTWFPHGNCVLVGVGHVPPGSKTLIEYDDEGVTYDPA